MNPLANKPLLHFEQRVNDRRRTSAAPAIDASLLPESGASRPLAWRRLPRDEVEIFASRQPEAASALAEIGDERWVYLPVHPLAEAELPPSELFHSGSIQVSASYRTVFYTPESGGPFADWIPAGQTLMIKLHLEQPLPGIAGDRRLTRDKIEKCVLLSDELTAATSGDPLARRLRIVPEFLGVSHRDGGVLYRLLPEHGLIPAFSLHSRDSTRPEEPSLVIQRLEALYGADRRAAANDFGPALAGPLVRGMLAGMRAGFSLEMHAQNTLLELGQERLIEQVLFRDLEGVVFSDRYRQRQGLPPLFPDLANEELLWPGASMQRWYNRNLDHDIGRILQCVLEELLLTNYFSKKEHDIALGSVRREVRAAVREAGLTRLHRSGRWLPFTRSPYGNGRRLGHYYRSRYR